MRTVTDTLQKQTLESVVSDQLEYFLSPFPSGVGGVKYTHITFVILEEAKSVIESSISDLSPQLQSLSIVII